jgi:hypothetical protein
VPFACLVTFGLPPMTVIPGSAQAERLWALVMRPKREGRPSESPQTDDGLSYAHFGNHGKEWFRVMVVHSSSFASQLRRDTLEIQRQVCVAFIVVRLRGLSASARGQIDRLCRSRPPPPADPLLRWRLSRPDMIDSRQRRTPRLQSESLDVDTRIETPAWYPGQSATARPPLSTQAVTSAFGPRAEIRDAATPPLWCAPRCQTVNRHSTRSPVAVGCRSRPSRARPVQR